jgi:hypothetical protein
LLAFHHNLYKESLRLGWEDYVSNFGNFMETTKKIKQKQTCSLKNRTLNHCFLSNVTILVQASDKNCEILAVYCKFIVKKLTFGTFKAQTRNCSSERIMEGIE